VVAIIVQTLAEQWTGGVNKECNDHK